ncbi:hypothetical protein SAMN05216548_105126 [Faunimonas pinastri]|uniref:Uncharacterized protein n=1 Tax=Faunimonas pinastri TaxID=1855383 RepID=A0A1H9GRJ2_9HYPH|nr:hypothetical protein [Faunimonas pinastri]SEQ52674.1 hypothetical protein SAMN05216548_105126 [Faunimonas pinastri]
MPPDPMNEVLRNLPLRIGTYVPDDLLQAWFAPAAEPQNGSGAVSEAALDAARDYGWKFECEFTYDADRKEGVFWKWVPAI